MAIAKPIQGVPHALKEATQNSTLVPWIGAGFSTPYGFPMMSALLGELIDELQAAVGGTDPDERTELPEEEKARVELFKQCRADLESESADYAEIADKVRTAVDVSENHRFFSALRKVLVRLDEGSKSVSYGHYFLRVLAPQRMVTTNYDRLLERHVVPSAAVVTGRDHASIHFYIQYDRHSPVLFKLHGDLGRPDTIPFSNVQFQEIYDKCGPDRSRIPMLLRSLYADSTLLFIGSSMSSSEKYFPYLKAFFRNVAPNPLRQMQLDTVGTGRHFALLSKPDDSERMKHQENELRELGVKVLWYIPDDERHTQVWEFLANLAIEARVDAVENRLRGNEWRGVYAPKERMKYLQHQLMHEKKASSVTFITPKLSNAIATDEFIAKDCRAALEHSPVFDSLDLHIIDGIVEGMQERRANLEMRLEEAEGEFSVHALMTTSALNATLKAAAKKDNDTGSDSLRRIITRYRHAIDLSKRTPLDIRLTDRFSESADFRDGSYTPDSYALIIAPYEAMEGDSASGDANLVLAFAAQANNAGFATQLIEANTPMVETRLARAERIVSTAWSQADSLNYIERALQEYEQ